eukprot:TRINITY_DN444_c0_g1_i1.p1 TRINITY_DN444_c0_g1~~TRINITY_DN444_c0_g1_i1.p1  ORF type:complete len:230 (+),score=64.05 TRINITY_DN444_c0_g1_i1:102-791(+)
MGKSFLNLRMLIARFALKRSKAAQSWLSLARGFAEKKNEDEERRLQTEEIKRQNKDVEGVKVNLDRQRERQEGKLPLDRYNIYKPSDVYTTKKKSPTENVLSFIEPTLARKKELLQIYGLGNGYFAVNDVWYPGSIIAFPQQIFLWDVTTAADIRAHSLDILEVIKPTPQYVIIGTGKERYPIEESFYKRFLEKGIKFDILPTFEACSTYNVCNEDGINMCAFLIPANL